MQQQGFRPSTLVPRGFVVERAVFGDTGALITVRHASKGNACPRCGRISERVHSRYHRRLLDLPVAGRRAGVKPKEPMAAVSAGHPRHGPSLDS